MAQKNITNIKITMSMLSTDGGLYSIRDSAGARETALKMVCPSCNNSLLDQVYCCQAGCVPDGTTPGKFTQGWTTREVPNRVRVEGKGANQTLIPVTAEEIDDAKKGNVESGTLDLAVYPADQVEEATGPGSNTYCFVPDKADKVYTLLLNAAANPKKALIGIINLRGTEKLYRLQAHQGTLRAVELLHPEETAIFPAAIEAPVVEAEQKLFDSILDALSDDFDPEAYANSKLAGLRDLLASKSGLAGTGATITPIKAAPAAAGLEQIMAAVLAAATAAKLAKSA